MQWLIDICKAAMTETINALKAWVEAKGYLTAGFVDRGDPAAYDFELNYFVRNAQWHLLDLSGIVPENAKAVLLLAYSKATVINNDFMVRMHGNVNLYSRSQLRTFVADVAIFQDWVVNLDTDRKIDYKLDIGNWTAAGITVKGWWF